MKKILCVFLYGIFSACRMYMPARYLPAVFSGSRIEMQVSPGRWSCCLRGLSRIKYKSCIRCWNESLTRRRWHQPSALTHSPLELWEFGFRLFVLLRENIQVFGFSTFWLSRFCESIERIEFFKKWIVFFKLRIDFFKYRIEFFKKNKYNCSSFRRASPGTKIVLF